MMHTRRLDLIQAEKRLQQFPALASVLGSRWLKRQYSKPIEKWSLITGWISRSDETPYRLMVEDMDRALALLQKNVSPNIFAKISRKIRAHSGRAESKGTLAELAVWVFLSGMGIEFDLEAELKPGSAKNIDVAVRMQNNQSLYLEVQWLSASDSSERAAAVAATYGEGIVMRNEEEKWRIKKKIFDKTPKLTVEDISLVALDCTGEPIHGGNTGVSLIEETVFEAFTGHTWQGQKTDYAESDVDTAIRKYVDGVIWFDWEPGNQFRPMRRDFCLNPNSSHYDSNSLSTFVKLWAPELVGKWVPRIEAPENCD